MALKHRVEPCPRAGQHLAHDWNLPGAEFELPRWCPGVPEPAESVFTDSVTFHEIGATEAPDPVNHPPHYTSHPSGIECIQITEHMGFNLGNAMKYIWRADLKGDDVEDLRKAAWYLDREIKRREAVR